MTRRLDLRPAPRLAYPGGFLDNSGLGSCSPMKVGFDGSTCLALYSGSFPDIGFGVCCGTDHMAFTG